ncbi:MAG: hypothetical protein HY892_03515 [Deltaproteobacteria bacterium]|nr:hypothetical protein [Deltaproteobacteria bacterium]
MVPLLLVWLAAVTVARAAAPCPPLPPAAGAVAYVANVSELVSAVNNAVPGLSILLADGIYPLNGEYLRIDVPDLTLRSAGGNREAVILDGNYQTTEIIQITASRVTVADLTLRKAYYHPIHVMSTDQGDTFQTLVYNVHIVDPGEQAIKINPYTGTGALFFPDHGTIACSHIELTAGGRQQVRNNCYTGGIDAHQARGWVVRDNRIEGFWCPEGLSEHAVHFWKASRDTLIERNYLIDNARGIGLGLLAEGSARVYPDQPCPTAGGGYLDHYGGLVRNNFVFAGNAGLFASAYGFDCGLCLWQACEAKALHNTVASTQPPFSSIEWRFERSRVELINNLTTHNLMDRGGTAYLSGNLTGQPLALFVNGPTGDLHLAATASAALDQVAAPPEVTDDFDGDRRPAGLQTDVGADEFRFLEVIPLRRQIPSGGTAIFQIAVTTLPGYGGSISLQASSPSTDLLLDLQPNSVTPPGQAALTVTDLFPGPALSGRLYQIPVTALVSGFSQTVPASLLIGGTVLHLPVVLR